MKDKIQKNAVQTYVQLFLDDIELNISVTDKLKRQEGNLKNFGFIQITDGGKDSETVFWDNLKFFYDIKYKSFKIECGDDLKKINFPPKKTYKTIKKLIKRAKKLDLITI